MPLSAPGVAAGNAFGGQPGAFEWSPDFEGLQGVGAAGGGVAASRGCERRNGVAVQQDQGRQGGA